MPAFAMLHLSRVGDGLAAVLRSCRDAPRRLFATAAPTGAPRVKTAHRCNGSGSTLLPQGPPRRIENRIRRGQFGGTFHASCFAPFHRCRALMTARNASFCATRGTTKATHMKKDRNGNCTR